jgi:hypothetical protein
MAAEFPELDQYDPLVVRRGGSLDARVQHELVAHARRLRLDRHENALFPVLR